MVTAIILLNTERGKVQEVAQAMAGMPEITEVYSVGGRFDLIAMVRVRENEALAELVTKKLVEVPGITHTETNIAFRAYSKFDLENMFDIGVD